MPFPPILETDRAPPPSQIRSDRSKMAVFPDLEDSPMFRKQLHSLEHSSEELKDRCQKLLKGCNKFMSALEEAYDGDMAFADSLEAFGSGKDDALSVSVGGPVMSKFTTTVRELGTYKELLRSQLEHMLADRLTQFMSMELQEVKDARRRLDKASLAYDQAREKFMSLKKGTRPDIISFLEEELSNSKSSFERCRFNLVNALANVEARKKFAFLESISAAMDAHLRYFKQGYELLSQMEPFVHEVLTFVHQSREMANNEQDKLAQRIQEFRTQAELDNLRNSSHMEPSTSSDNFHGVGMSSYKEIEALMQSTANGKVETIKQGYLLKRSSSLRGDWKRRFFVLDSHGTLYYYRTKNPAANSHQSSGMSEHGGVFGRFKFTQHWVSSQDEENLGCRTVDLRTSIIKMDAAEQSDLRFCFRIISPLKTYTLQAENGADRKDWVDKIRGVTASLLNSPFHEQAPFQRLDVDTSSLAESEPEYLFTRGDTDEALEGDVISKGHDNVCTILRKIRGNNKCAECDSLEPEWASLNLGILLCIECSGVHRNLGVHVSKVRSLTLDVRVWEPTILDLFHALGNTFCNSVWEEVLQIQDVSGVSAVGVKKPTPKDDFSIKEIYIQFKYVEKMLIVKPPSATEPSLAASIWQAVKSSDIKRAYKLLVTSDYDSNMTYDDLGVGDTYHSCDIQDGMNNISIDKPHDPQACPYLIESGNATSCLQGCSILHLACHGEDLAMIELLLQFGADINRRDFHGRTPLHHCVAMGNDSYAKYLLRRGARPMIRDGGGQTALERRMELMGAITDEQLFLLLASGE